MKYFLLFLLSLMLLRVWAQEASSVTIQDTHFVEICRRIEFDLENKKWQSAFYELQKMIQDHEGGDFSPSPLRQVEVPPTVLVTPATKASQSYSLFHHALTLDSRKQPKNAEVVPQEPFLYQGPKSWAEYQILLLPEEARQIYRSLFDAQSNDLEQAIQTQNQARLFEIFQRFFFSSSGIKAGLILTEWWILSGDFLRAKQALSRLLTYGGSELEEQIPRLLAQWAFCSKSLEDLDGIAQAFQWLQQFRRTQLWLHTLEAPPSSQILCLHYFSLFQEIPSPLASALAQVSLSATSPSITLGGTEVKVETYLENLLKQTSVQLQEEDWPTYSGNFLRNRLSKDPGISVEKDFQWSIPLPPLKPIENRHSEASYSYPYQPIVDHERIYVNDGLQVRAFNLWTKEEVWRYRGFTHNDFSETSALYRNEHLLFSVTSDQHSVYANIEEPPESQRDVFQEGSQQEYEIRRVIPRRSLVCLDAKQGTVIWTSRQAEDKILKKASFVSAPLIYKDLLFCGASYFEGTVSTYLVCLEKKTGKILYRRYLSGGQQEMNMFGCPIREAIGTVPTEKDGIIYYGTNIGTVVALEAYSGRLLWLVHYPQSPIPPPKSYTTSFRDLQWYNNPILLKKHFLLITPVDSPQILALNRYTGNVIWRRDREASKWNLRYLLGADEEQVYLSGNVVLALKLATGEKVWENRKGLMLPRGRGVLSESAVYVPIDESLYAFDKKEGQLLNETKDREWGAKKNRENSGNLLFAQNALFVSSNDSLMAYFNLQKTEKELLLLIKKSAQDPLLLCRLAFIYLQDKRFSLAEAQFEKARKLCGKDPQYHKLLLEIQEGLYQIYFQQGQKEDQTPKKLAYYHKALGESGSQSSAQLLVYEKILQIYRYTQKGTPFIATWKFLIEKYGEESFSFLGLDRTKVAPYGLHQLADYCFENKQFSEGVAYYQKIIKEYPLDRIEHQEGQRFATRQIQKIIEKCGREVYQVQEKEAQEYLQKAEELKSLELYQKILQYYPNSVLKEACSYGLIRLKFQQKHKELLPLMKQFLQEFPESTYQAQLLYYLFSLYFQEDRLTPSKKILQILATQYSDQFIEVEQQKVKVLVKDWIVTLNDERLKRSMTPLEREVDLKLSEEQQTHSWRRSFNEKESFRLYEVQGLIPPECQDRFYLFSGNTLFCLSAHEEKKTYWQKTLSSTPDFLYYAENILIIVSKQEIKAYTLEGQKEVWSYSFASEALSLTARHGILTAVLVESQQLVLFLFDALKGILLEKTVLAPFEGLNPQLFISQDFVVVAVPSKLQLTYFVFDWLNGHLKHRILGTLTQQVAPTLLLEPNLLVFLDQEIQAQNQREVLKAYHLNSGTLLWEKRSFSQLSRQTLVGHGKQIALVQEIQNKKQILVLSAETGALQWCHPELQLSVENLTMFWDYLYFYTIEFSEGKVKRKLVALRSDSGELAWKQHLRYTTYQKATIFSTKEYICAHFETKEEVKKNREDSFKTIFLIYEKGSGKLIRKYEPLGHRFAEYLVIDQALIVVRDSIVYSYTSK